MSYYYTDTVRAAHEAAEAAVSEALATRVALSAETLEVDDRLTELTKQREDLKNLEARHEAKVAAMHTAIEEQATNWPYDLSDPQEAETKMELASNVEVLSVTPINGQTLLLLLKDRNDDREYFYTMGTASVPRISTDVLFDGLFE